MSYTNPLSTLATDPVRNFKFVVEFLPESADGKWGASFGKMGFVSLSGLSVTTESIAYREGGYNTNVHQIPGQSSFSPISLSKGVMLGNDAHAKWMRRLFSVLTPNATSGIGANFRCDIDIAVLSHPNPAAFAGSASTTAAATAYDQHASMRFRVHNAWITSLGYSNLDAGSSTLMVEEMTLVHEGFDVTFGSNYTESGSAKKFNANGTFGS
jgi:phage tail-like protein